MGKLAAFAHQQNADQEEDEEAEYLVHAVSLQEARDMAGERQHEAAGDDNGGGHDDEVVGQRNGREHRIEGKDYVHGDDPHQRHDGRAQGGVRA